MGLAALFASAAWRSFRPAPVREFRCRICRPLPALPGAVRRFAPLRASPGAAAPPAGDRRLRQRLRAARNSRRLARASRSCRRAATCSAGAAGATTSPTRCWSAKVREWTAPARPAARPQPRCTCPSISTSIAGRRRRGGSPMSRGSSRSPRATPILDRQAYMLRAAFPPNTDHLYAGERSDHPEAADDRQPHGRRLHGLGRRSSSPRRTWRTNRAHPLPVGMARRHLPVDPDARDRPSIARPDHPARERAGHLPPKAQPAPGNAQAKGPRRGAGSLESRRATAAPTE